MAIGKISGGGGGVPIDPGSGGVNSTSFTKTQLALMKDVKHDLDAKQAALEAESKKPINTKKGLKTMSQINSTHAMLIQQQLKKSKP